MSLTWAMYNLRFGWHLGFLLILDLSAPEVCSHVVYKQHDMLSCTLMPVDIVGGLYVAPPLSR